MLWEIGLGFDESKMLFVRYLPVLRVHLLPWVSQTAQCIFYEPGNSLPVHVEKGATSVLERKMVSTNVFTKFIPFYKYKFFCCLFINIIT